jgi:site-specific recombinase XerD
VEHIPFPRQAQTRPVVLSLAEVAQFFQARTRLKYRAILLTAYAAGLRACQAARRAAGVGKAVTVRALRPSVASHLLGQGTDLRTIQILWRHRTRPTAARSAQVSARIIAAAPEPLGPVALVSAPVA